jgi:hypothetical protein
MASLVEGGRVRLVAVFYCTCKSRRRVWAEFWWKPDENKHEWAFFDDHKGSESYGESVTNCLGCGERLHRGMLTPK